MFLLARRLLLPPLLAASLAGARSVGKRSLSLAVDDAESLVQRVEFQTLEMVEGMQALEELLGNSRDVYGDEDMSYAVAPMDDQEHVTERALFRNLVDLLGLMTPSLPAEQHESVAGTVLPALLELRRGLGPRERRALDRAAQLPLAKVARNTGFGKSLTQAVNASGFTQAAELLNSALPWLQLLCHFGAQLHTAGNWNFNVTADVLSDLASTDLLTWDRYTLDVLGNISWFLNFANDQEVYTRTIVLANPLAKISLPGQAFAEFFMFVRCATGRSPSGIDPNRTCAHLHFAEFLRYEYAAVCELGDATRGSVGNGTVLPGWSWWSVYSGTNYYLDNVSYPEGVPFWLRFLIPSRKDCPAYSDMLCLADITENWVNYQRGTGTIETFIIGLANCTNGLTAPEGVPAEVQQNSFLQVNTTLNLLDDMLWALRTKLQLLTGITLYFVCQIEGAPELSYGLCSQFDTNPFNFTAWNESEHNFLSPEQMRERFADSFGRKAWAFKVPSLVSILPSGKDVLSLLQSDEEQPSTDYSWEDMVKAGLSLLQAGGERPRPSKDPKQNVVAESYADLAGHLFESIMGSLKSASAGNSTLSRNPTQMTRPPPQKLEVPKKNAGGPALSAKVAHASKEEIKHASEIKQVAHVSKEEIKHESEIKQALRDNLHWAAGRVGLSPYVQIPVVEMVLPALMDQRRKSSQERRALVDSLAKIRMSTLAKQDLENQTITVAAACNNTWMHDWIVRTSAMLQIQRLSDWWMGELNRSGWNFNTTAYILDEFAKIPLMSIDPSYVGFLKTVGALLHGSFNHSITVHELLREAHLNYTSVPAQVVVNLLLMGRAVRNGTLHSYTMAVKHWSDFLQSVDALWPILNNSAWDARLVNPLLGSYNYTTWYFWADILEARDMLALNNITTQEFIDRLANATSQLGIYTNQTLNDTFTFFNSTRWGESQWAYYVTVKVRWLTRAVLLYLCHVTGGPDNSFGMCDGVLDPSFTVMPDLNDIQFDLYKFWKRLGIEGRTAELVSLPEGLA